MKKYQWRVGLLTEIAPSLDTGLVRPHHPFSPTISFCEGSFELSFPLWTSQILAFDLFLQLFSFVPSILFFPQPLRRLRLRCLC